MRFFLKKRFISIVKTPSLMGLLELSFVFGRCLGLGLKWEKELRGVCLAGNFLMRDPPLLYLISDCFDTGGLD